MIRYIKLVTLAGLKLPFIIKIIIIFFELKRINCKKLTVNLKFSNLFISSFAKKRSKKI